MATPEQSAGPTSWGDVVWHGTIVLLYVALAWVATQLGVNEVALAWYPSAGLAVALLTVHGLRSVPALVAGELLVLLLLRPVGTEATWMAVPEAVAYIAVYAVAGRALARFGGASADASTRRSLGLLIVGGLAAPVLAALTTVVVPLALGTLAPPGLARALMVRTLGEGVGIASTGVTVTVALVRRRRGGRWWALPDTDVLTSLVLAVVPAVVVLVVHALTGDLLLFAGVLFVPVLAIAMARGVSAIALSAPLTAMAVMLRQGPASEQPQLQLMLLLLLAIGLCAGLVTEQRTNLALRLSERQRHLDRAQQQAGAGSFTWNVPDDEVTWSKGLYALFGVDPQPIRRGQYLDHVHPADRRRVSEQLLDVMRTAGSVVSTYRVLRTDGAELVVRAHVEARTFDGRVVELTGSCFDVSAEERARLYLERAVLREREAAASRELADSVVARTNRIKDALLIAVSHEVRTPLTIIRGVGETLLREELADTTLGDHERSLMSLDRHSRRLESVLLDLMDVDRVGRGILTPTPRPTDLRALVADVLAPMHLPVTFAIDVPAHELDIDARLVGRILEHLTANAARHSPTGGRVCVRAAVDGDLVHLCVDDEGPGVPVPERTRVFEAFEQTTIVRHSPGTGVGLYLVASFAQLHGGTAWVTDGPTGSGATFHATVSTTLAHANGDAPPA